MKKLIGLTIRLSLIIIITAVLASCGSGGSSGGSSSGKDLKVRIHIDQSSFRNADARLKVNGYTIASLMLNVSAVDIPDKTDISREILSNVENNGYVTLELEKDITYVFEISASDASDKELCYGSATSLIREGVNEVNLQCDSGEADINITVLTGVVAAGLPVTGKVYLKDANGTVVSTNINPDGSYSIDTTGLTPAFVLKAEGVVGTTPVSMVSFTEGINAVVNINSYTNLAMAMATGASNPDDIFDNPDTYEDTLNNENVTNSVQQVTQVFSEFLASFGITDFDPLSGSYSADGTGADGVLDYISVNISDGAVTIVDKTSGETLVSSPVTQVSSSNTTISGSVVTNIVQYVNEGPAQIAEAEDFIIDLYTTRTRGNFAAYVDTDMVWHNGISRANFISGAFAPDAGTSIDNFIMYSRISGSEMIVYFYITDTDGERTPVFQWVIKKNGVWYLSGNDRMFRRGSTPFSVKFDGYDGTETFRSGIKLSASDPSSRGIEIITVTGPGLPPAGIRLVPGDDGFVITEADRTDDGYTNEYFFTAAQISAFNSAVSTSGYASYTYTAYTAASNNQPSGTALQALTEKISTKSITAAALQSNPANYFINASGITEQNLTALLDEEGVSESFSLPGLSVLYGNASLECTDTSGNIYFNETALPLGSSTVSVNTSAVSESALNSLDNCVFYLSYLSSSLAYYTAGWEYRLADDAVVTPTDAQLLSEDIAGFDETDILGSNTSSSEITSDLSLVNTLTNGTALTYSSSDTSVIADSGTVSRPSYTSGDAEITLTVTASNGSAAETFTLSFTVSALSATDSELLAETELTQESVLGDNQSASEITSDLSLIHEFDNGVTVIWKSSDTSVITDGGAVTRPSYTQGDTDVTMSATLHSGSETAEKTLTFSVLAADATDAELLSEDTSDFDETDILGSNTSASEITSDLSLITSFANGSSVTYSSSDTSVIADNGTVSRPSYTSGDAEITFTVTVSKGDSSETFIFSFTVTAEDPTDEELLTEGLSSFTAADILQNNPDTESVTGNLNLISTWGSSIDIVWSFDNENYISEDGTVTRPTYTEGDAEVTLTAEASYGTASETKTFTLTVLAADATDAELVSEAINNYSISDTLGDNSDASDITADLVLDTVLDSGVTLTWESSDETYITASGSVTQPTYSSSAVNITLTATASLNGETDTFTFNYTVTAASAANTVTAYIRLAASYGSVIEIYDINDMSAELSLNTSSSIKSSEDADKNGEFTYEDSGLDRDGMYLVMVYSGTAEDLNYDGSAENETVYGSFYAVIDGETAVNGGFYVNELTDIVYRKLAYMLASGASDSQISAAADITAGQLIHTDINSDSTIDYKDVLAFSAFEHTAIGSGTADYLMFSNTELLNYTDAVVYNYRSDLFSKMALYSSNINSNVSIAPTDYEIQFSGDNAFILDGTVLYAYDMSDPNSPSAYTSLTLDSSGYSLSTAIASDYFFVTDETNGTFQIADVSSPSSMSKESPVSVEGLSAVAAASDAGYMYAAHHDSGEAMDLVTYYDLSDKSNPVAGSEVNPAFLPEVMIIDDSGEYLYAAASGSFAVFDITAPANPNIIYEDIDGEVHSGFVYGLKFYNDAVYMLTAEGISVIDVSTPSAPAFAMSVSYTYGVTSIDVDDGKLYVMDHYNAAIDIYDLSASTAPVLIRKITEPYYQESLTVIKANGSYGLITIDGEVAETSVIDLTKTTYDSYGYSYDTDYPVNRLAADYDSGLENFYLFTTSSAGTIIYNIDSMLAETGDPSTAYVYEDENDISEVYGLTLFSNYLYTISDSSLFTFDISDPDNMANPDVQADQSASYSFLVSNGSYLYHTSGGTIYEHTLSSYVPTGANTSYTLGSSEELNNPVSIGSYVYVPEFFGDIYIIQPGVGDIGTLGTTSTTAIANINDTYLAAANTTDSTIDIYDVSSSPAEPELISRVYTSSYGITQMYANSNHLFTLDLSMNISAFDISDITNPSETASFSSISTSIFADDDYLYLASGSHGFKILPAVTQSLPYKSYDSTVLSENVSYFSDSEILNGNSSFDSVVSDLYLYETGDFTPDTDTADITWYSSDETVIDTYGTVTRPASGDGDAEVTLTAEITYGEEISYIVYNITVLESPQARVFYGGLLDTAYVGIYDITDMTDSEGTAEYSTTAGALAGDVTDISGAGYFTYDPSGFSSDQTYLVHINTDMDTVAFDPAYIDDSNDSGETYANAYAIVSGEDIMKGGYSVNALTDMIYRNVSYILMADMVFDTDNYSSATEELFAMMDKYAKILIGYDIDGSGTVDYSDALAYDPYDHAAELYGTLNTSFEDLQAYEETGKYMLLTASDFARFDVNVYSASTSYSAYKMLVSEDTLFITGNAEGLISYDLSSDFALESPAVYTTNVTVHDADIYGNYAVLAEGSNGVRKLDLSGTDTDVVISGLNNVTDVLVNETAANEAYAYLLDEDDSNAGTPSGLCIIDFTSADTGLSSTYYSGFHDTYGEDPVDLTADSSMNYLYVITDSYLFILDIHTDMENPALQNTPSASLTSRTMHEAVISQDDSTLYIATEKGIRVMDVSVPSAPTEIEILAGSDEFVSVRITGDVLYGLTSSSGTLMKYDISSPSSPALSGRIFDVSDSSEDGSLTSLALYGDYAYAGHASGINVINTADTYDLIYGSYVKTDYRVNDLKIQTGSDSVSYGYTAAGDDIFAIYDMTDPENPTFSSKPDAAVGSTDDTASRIEVDSEYAYIMADSSFYTFDISTAGSETGNTQYTEIYDNSSYSSGMTNGSSLILDGTRLFTIFGNEIYKFDFSSGITDTYVTSTSGDFDFSDGIMYTENETTDYIITVNGEGDYSVISDSLDSQQSGLTFMNTSLNALGTIDSDMLITGSFSYAELSTGVGILFDLYSLPGYLSDIFPISGTPADVTADSDYFYVANGEGVSILAFDYYNEYGYFEAGFIKTPGDAVSVYVDSYYIYISDSYGGMMIVPKPVRVPPYIRDSGHDPYESLFTSGMALN